MKHYTDTIPVTLAEKLKEKGMPMEVWDRKVQGMPYIAIIERIPYNWLDDEMGILESEMVERRYSIPTYAEVFDWLMLENGLHIIVEPYWDFAEEVIDTTYEWSVVKSGTIHADTPYSHCNTWHEAANAAIEGALTLI